MEMVATGHICKLRMGRLWGVRHGTPAPRFTLQVSSRLASRYIESVEVLLLEVDTLERTVEPHLNVKI
jgi:hypothetical protein